MNAEERLLHAIFAEVLEEEAPVANQPKPGPPKRNAAPVEVGVDISTKPKPQFVRKPHLTNRPLRGHKGLEALKAALEKPIPAKKYPTPRRGQRRINKEKK